jgi:signal transduction histidine kinase
LNRTLHLSNLLAARRAEILERWTRRISREHADKDLSHGELWDHLPLFWTEQHQIEVSVVAPDTLPYSGDMRLLRSAIGNIVGNAIKFTHGSQGIAVRAEQRPDCLVLEIEDHCGRLPDGNSEELFEPFVQRGEDRTGFGLGPAIVKQAIDAHGGRVLVRNVPGTGCVFIFQLPLVKAG